MSESTDRRQRREEARDARIAQERAAATSAARRRRLAILGAVAAAVAVAVAVIAVATGGGDSEQPPANVEGVASTRALLSGVRQDGDVLGDPRAPVTLVEYADLQCPICAAYAQEVLPIIIRDYVRPGRVRIQLRVVSILGEDSTRAQRFAAATAAQDRLWSFAHLFYENQGEEHSGYITDDFLRRIAAATPGLDADRAVADQGSTAARRLVDAADAAGIDSTPTFRIGTSGGALREVDISNGPQGLIAALDRATR